MVPRQGSVSSLLFFRNPTLENMKTKIPLSLLFLIVTEAFTGGLLAQTVPANPLVPKDSIKRSTRNLGGGSGGIEAGLSGKTRETKTIVVQYHAVSTLREWTNLEGKKISARLLAYSVPRPGTTGAAEVLREGKVLFLIPGKSKPVEYPKEQLVDDDQIEIERIVEAASFTKMPPRESEEKTAAERETDSEKK